VDHVLPAATLISERDSNNLAGPNCLPHFVLRVIVSVFELEPDGDASVHIRSIFRYRIQCSASCGKLRAEIRHHILWIPDTSGEIMFTATLYNSAPNTAKAVQPFVIEHDQIRVLDRTKKTGMDVCGERSDPNGAG
jgi:hypothetical protein